jgi:dipeptidyl aminopeptidase/acylaminoacyl peptidase
MFSLLVFVSHAAGALIPRADLFGNPERTQARLSPDGAWLSWLAPRHGYLNIWVAPLGNDGFSPESAMPLTNDTVRGITNHYWAHTSSDVLWMQDVGGNENYHVFSVSVGADGSIGEERDLTEVADGVRASIESLSPSRPGVALISMNERNAQLFDLWEVDIASGARTLAMENPGGVGWWAVDGKLQPRFGFQQAAGGSGSLMRPSPSGNASEPWDEFLAIDQADALSTAVSGFDATETALFLLSSAGRDTTALRRIDIASGESVVMGSDAHADVVDVVMHPTAHAPIAYAVNYMRKTWRGVAPYDADVDALTSAVYQRAECRCAADAEPSCTVCDLSIVSVSDAFDAAVVFADAPTMPGKYFIWRRSAPRDVRPLFVTRPALAGASLAPMLALEIPARDGKILVSYLTLPLRSAATGASAGAAQGGGARGGATPMVLMVHGGPWMRDAYGYNSWHQWLSNRGYAVLSVNYRGSTGFGKSFVNAALKQFSKDMQTDLMDAVAYVRAAGPRLDLGSTVIGEACIAGGSYGGYATLIGMTFTPTAFACGVDIVGPSSLVTLMQSFPEYWRPMLEPTWYAFVGDPSDPAALEDMRLRSALPRVDEIVRPLLVGQGENDPRVKKQEADQLVAAMRERSIPVTYVNFPDEGHGFARPANRLAFYSVMEGFLTTYLPPQAGYETEPIGGSAFAGSSLQVLAGGATIPGLDAALAKKEAAAAATAAQVESAAANVAAPEATRGDEL